MSEDPEGISPGESQQAEGLVVKWETLLVRAGCGSPIIAHARTVTDLALRFAESALVNRDLVLAGAMLHDIG
ncbi:MAG: HD domain-containing protein, partial [Methanomicrobiales archaeon]|nr:HD domain-containing protein [Methanomicrobiales archaeon]